MTTPGADRTPTRIVVDNWRQFEHVDIDLSRRLTVLTGANGSGKTTLIAIIAKHFAWETRFAAVPVQDEFGRRSYVPDWREEARQLLLEDAGPTRTGRSEAVQIGTLQYSDGTVGQMQVPPGQAESYDIALSPTGWFTLNGIYLSAFRTPTMYTKLDSIPAEFKTPAAMLADFVNEIRKRYQSKEFIKPNESAFRTMKQSLVAAAVFGPGNESVVRNPEAAAVWQRYQEVLTLLLPPELGFKQLRVQSPEVLIENKHGDQYSIDAVSGGVGAIMELAWQVLLQSWGADQFCVLMDEPENHLHPSLQRTLLPNLLKAFPSAKFVVASHSPFIVTSEPAALVYALGFSEEGRVQSRAVEGTDLSGTADATLREILGVESTRPAWAVERFQAILDAHLNKPSSPENLRALNEELREAGLGNEVPRAISAYVDAQELVTDADVAPDA